MKKNIFKILYILLAISLLLFIVSYFLENRLPDLSQIDSSLYQEPSQNEVSSSENIVKEEKGVKYQIQPVYDYELWGLVVSQNDNEVWYSRFKRTDPLNTKDFCVVWGENIKNGSYRDVKFKTEEFVCLYSYKNNIQFNQNQLSNNHMLYPNDELYKVIRSASIGDQIHFKGSLASYKATDKNGKEMTRGTSTTRTDAGQNACETVYATEFNIIKATTSNLIFRYIFNISKYLFSLVFLVLLILILTNLFKPEKEIKKNTGFIDRNKKYKDLLPPSVGKDL